MSQPDFVGVGFPKCGTTFFYNTLVKTCPSVRALPKERHFFSEPITVFDDSDHQEYRSKFPESGISGEFSPGILYYPLNIRFLSQAAPDARIVAMIRNPVDRCFSHMKEMLENRQHNVNPRNKKLFVEQSLYPEAVYSGNYYSALNRLFKYYSKDQVIILQYEKILESFEEEFEKAYDFLGIEEYDLSGVEIRKPSDYSEFDYFRDYLAEHYRKEVEELFANYNNINRWSSISVEKWDDYSYNKEVIDHWA